MSAVMDWLAAHLCTLKFQLEACIAPAVLWQRSRPSCEHAAVTGPASAMLMLTADG